MKKLFTLVLMIALFIVSCGEKGQKLRVGATPIPHGDLLNLVKDDLKKEGIDLEVVPYTDYMFSQIRHLQIKV